MSGWIKVHRALVRWEWFTDVNTAHLFIYLLLSANHTTTKWRGQIILPGQILTGRNKLSEETGLSIQQIRSSLDKLKTTSELTIKTYNKYSIITICNWKTYQENNQQNVAQVTSEPTSELTINQPTSNQQVTTSKNVNNIKKDKEERNPLSIFKNKILNEEMKKYAEEKGVFGKQLETSWQRFLIKKGNAMIDKRCSYEEFFADWQLWILNERVQDSPEKDAESEKLSIEDAFIQSLGSAAWKRKNKMSLNPEQKRLLNDYESKNGVVWWDNLKKFKEGKSP